MNLTTWGWWYGNYSYGKQIHQIQYVYTIDRSVDTNGSKDLNFVFTDLSGVTHSLNRTVIFEISPPTLAYLTSNIGDNDTFFQGDFLYFRVFSDYPLNSNSPQNSTHDNTTATLLIDNQIVELDIFYSYWYNDLTYTDDTTQYSYLETFRYRVDPWTDTNGTHVISFIFTDINETKHYLNSTANFTIYPLPGSNVSLSSDIVDRDVFDHGDHLIFTVETEYPYYNETNTTAVLYLDSTPVNLTIWRWWYENNSSGDVIYQIQYVYTIDRSVDTNGSKDLNFVFTDLNEVTHSLNRTVIFEISPPILAYLTSNIGDNDTFFQGDFLYFRVFSDYPLNSNSPQNSTHDNTTATLLIDNQIVELDIFYSYWYNDLTYTDDTTQYSYLETFRYRVDPWTDTNGTHVISFIFTDINETKHYLNSTANFTIYSPLDPNVSLSSNTVYEWSNLTVLVTSHDGNSSIAFLAIDGEAREIYNYSYSYYDYYQSVYVHYYYYYYYLTDLDTNGTHTLHFNWTSDGGKSITLERQVHFIIEMTGGYNGSVEIHSNIEDNSTFSQGDFLYFQVLSDYPLNNTLDNTSVSLLINNQIVELRSDYWYNDMAGNYTQYNYGETFSYRVDRQTDTNGTHVISFIFTDINGTNHYLNSTANFTVFPLPEPNVSLSSNTVYEWSNLTVLVTSHDGNNSIAFLAIDGEAREIYNYSYSYYDYYQDAYIHYYYYYYYLTDLDTNGTHTLHFNWTSDGGKSITLERQVHFIIEMTDGYNGSVEIHSNVEDNGTFSQGDFLYFQVFSDYPLNSTRDNITAKLLINNQITELDESYHWYSSSTNNNTQYNYWETFGYRVDRRTDTNGTHFISFIFTDINGTNHYLNTTVNFSILPPPDPNVSLSSDEIYKGGKVRITVTYHNENNNSIAFLTIDGEARNFSNWNYSTPYYNSYQGVYVYSYHYYLTDLDTNGTHTLHFNWTSEEGTSLTLERQVHFIIEMNRSVEIHSNIDTGYLDTEIVIFNVTSNRGILEENATLLINGTYIWPEEMTYSNYSGEHAYIYFYNLSSISITDGSYLVYFSVTDSNGTSFELINDVYFNISHISIDPSYEEHTVPLLNEEITWDGKSSLVFVVRSQKALETIAYPSLYLDGKQYNSSHMMYGFDSFTNQYVAYYTYTFSHILEEYINDTLRSYLLDFSLRIMEENNTDIKQVALNTEAEAIAYTPATFASNVNESNILTNGDNITIIVHSDFMFYNNTFLTFGNDNVKRPVDLRLRSFVNNKFVFEFVYTVSNIDPPGKHILSFYFVDAAGYNHLYSVSVTVEHTVSVTVESVSNETLTSSPLETPTTDISVSFAPWAFAPVLLFLGIVSILFVVKLQRTRRKSMRSE